MREACRYFEGDIVFEVKLFPDLDHTVIAEFPPIFDELLLLLDEHDSLEEFYRPVPLHVIEVEVWALLVHIKGVFLIFTDHEDLLELCLVGQSLDELNELVRHGWLIFGQVVVHESAFLLQQVGVFENLLLFWLHRQFQRVYDPRVYVLHRADTAQVNLVSSMLDGFELVLSGKSDRFGYCLDPAQAFRAADDEDFVIILEENQDFLDLFLAGENPFSRVLETHDIVEVIRLDIRLPVLWILEDVFLLDLLGLVLVVDDDELVALSMEQVALAAALLVELPFLPLGNWLLQIAIKLLVANLLVFALHHGCELVVK